MLKAKATTKSTNLGFTDVEKEAMRARVGELASGGDDGASAVLTKINAMSGTDLTLAKRLHALVLAHAPTLTPKTWYGMPAYANADGKVVCFFKSAKKFKERYATFGFNTPAKLDSGNMWPTSYALTKITPAEESQIIALLKKAMG